MNIKEFGIRKSEILFEIKILVEELNNPHKDLTGFSLAVIDNVIEPIEKIRCNHLDFHRLPDETKKIYYDKFKRYIIDALMTYESDELLTPGSIL